MTLVCPNCYSSFPDNKNYCIKCGTKLPQNKPSATEKLRYSMIKQNENPIASVKKFAFIDAANDFFWKHRDIIVTGFHVDIGTRLGLFANHGRVNSIEIRYVEYPGKNLYHYKISEEEKKHWIVAHGIDKDLKYKWEANNPGQEFVTYCAAINSRGDAVSLVLHFGDIVEHVTYYILHRKKMV